MNGSRVSVFVVVLSAVFVADEAASQTTSPAGGATNVTRSTGSQSFGGRASAEDGIATDAGGAAAVSRDFGAGLVGRGDSAGVFVGNQDASTQQVDRRNRRNVQRPAAFNPRQTGPGAGSPVRGTATIGFSIPPAEASVRAETAATSLTTIGSVRPGLRGVRIELAARGEARLSGVVPTEQDRRLAEAIARLEPAIVSVRNEILVAP
ncbi:MAG: BON domain-containing protein [Planctomycetota bacterium]